MNTDVITRSFDSATGANTAETVLTPVAVRTRGIKNLLTLLTPDDPRLEAQPLYLSGINIAGHVRNVIYQATMGNTVYAWDADTGEPLWKTTLGPPINGSQAIDAHDINVKWGILSTPVIDRAAGAASTILVPGSAPTIPAMADGPTLRCRAGHNHRADQARQATLESEGQTFGPGSPRKKSSSSTAWNANSGPRWPLSMAL